MSRIAFSEAAPTATAALWGSSTFGGPITYGQEASDPVASIAYVAFHAGVGYPRISSWQYRVGDVMPNVEVAVATADGATIDGSAVDKASMVLDRLGGVPHQIVLDMIVLADGFECVLTDTDLDEPGRYRSEMKITMKSGRLLTVPTDDRVNFDIVEGG